MSDAIQGSTAAVVPLILASASPRRRDLLRQIGIHVKVEIPEVDETAHMVGVSGEGLAPEALVKSLARAKAYTIPIEGQPVLLLAADTIVLDPNGKVLGKPCSVKEARDMLESLSGAEHQVLTGVCLRSGRKADPILRHALTRVRFRTLSSDAIDRYIDSQEPFGKAGAYAIQGKGALLVRGIEGSYSNVVGLPLEILEDLFWALGYSLWDFVV